MREENKKNIDCDATTFIAYNETIGMIKVTEAQYDESTKEMCELTLFSILGKIYHMKDVYQKVLQYMKDNDIYGKYIKAILELQFNPPPQPQSQGNGEGQGEQTGEEDGSEQNTTSNSQNSNNEGENKGGGVASEQRKTDQVTKDFIRRMFSDDDNFNL